MKRSSLCAAVLAFSLAAPAAASTDVAVQNAHGAVTYESQGEYASHALPLGRAAALEQGSVIRTGADSVARVDFAATIESFSQGSVNRAHCILFVGHIRLEVRHPQGSIADYSVTTPAGTARIHGTILDFDVDPLEGVSINPYRAAQPVTFTAIDGSAYALAAGEKIWIGWEAGKLIVREGHR